MLTKTWASQKTVKTKGYFSTVLQGLENPLLNNTEGYRNSQCMTADGSSGFFAGSKSDKTCLLLRVCEYGQN